MNITPEMQAAWDAADPTDDDAEIKAAFAVALEKLDYDMSFCSREEQEFVGDAHALAMNLSEGHEDDSVTIAVAKALIRVLSDDITDNDEL